MFRRVVAVAALGMLLMPAAMFAQTPTAPRAVKPAVRAAARLRTRVRQAVRRGVRTGQLQPADVAQLRAKRQAIRERLVAIRQSGQRPTAEQRQAIRQDIRQALQDLRQRMGAIKRAP